MVVDRIVWVGLKGGASAHFGEQGGRVVIEDGKIKEAVSQDGRVHVDGEKIAVICEKTEKGEYVSTGVDNWLDMIEEAGNGKC